MAKKSTKKKSSSPSKTKKAVKKSTKGGAKKSAKKAAKKIVKKSAKGGAKKAVKRKIVKKVVKKSTKGGVKKSAPKKAAKKSTKTSAKGGVKKVASPSKSKKVAKKLAVAPKAKQPITKKALAPQKGLTPKKVVTPKPTPSPKFIKHKTHLKVGQPMPFFGGKDQHGNMITSASFSGKKLVVYFYPKDDTPGCTLEACNLRDNYGLFKSQGYEILGVSKDPITSHKKFADKFGLPFSLIADEDTTIQKLFGVWGKKMFMGKVFDGTNRFTFVTDENHVLTKVIEEVDTKEHTSQIL
jgi:thioredoxin-dependent peroxiredoxin